MAYVYAYLIVKGEKTYSQVPASLKEAVKAALIALDCEDLVV
ncbi:MAG: CD1375 family protein [Lachnotalea sp.]